MGRLSKVHVPPNHVLHEVYKLSDVHAGTREREREREREGGGGERERDKEMDG